MSVGNPLQSYSGLSAARPGASGRDCGVLGGLGNHRSVLSSWSNAGASSLEQACRQRSGTIQCRRLCTMHPVRPCFPERKPQCHCTRVKGRSHGVEERLSTQS